MFYKYIFDLLYKKVYYLDKIFTAIKLTFD